MSEICPSPGQMVDERINYVLTQYRESPRLLGLLTTYLSKVEEVALEICPVYDFFNLESAIGDQLTIVGHILGFPRCHCICATPPIVGYDCGGAYSGPYTLAGYCEPGSSWVHCASLGNSDVCLDDDDLYRSLLYSRVYQSLGMYDLQSLLEAITYVWGDGAQLVDSFPGKVVLSPGRTLSSLEQLILPIVFRSLPIAPGIQGLVHLGSDQIAGYGSGWAGYCGGVILCPTDPKAYSC